MLLFSLSYKLPSQTLINVTNQFINNPSFEDYTSCPTNASSPLPFGTLWIDSCKFWYAPTYGTSDYFNECANNVYVDIPKNNLIGFQFGYNGKAFCGFYAYSCYGPGVYSEYIQTKLITKLKPKSTYKFSMRINRSDFLNLSVSKIGAHFSKNNLVNNSSYSPLNFKPTILNQTGFLNDTLNWTLVSGEFLANGDEEYLTIGWFGDTLTSDYNFFIPPLIDSLTGDSLYSLSTYYVVDSLNLFEKTEPIVKIPDLNDFNIELITPNNDNYNDNLNFGNYNLSEFHFQVFNRWGNLVFETKNQNTKWEGQNNHNQKLPTGTYFYILNALQQSQNVIKKGYIQVHY